MAAQRPLLRIVLNVVLDGVLAALAVPLARWLADPDGAWAGPPWLPAAGAACLLIAGLPFRLSQQYWRFAGLGDLMGVAGASVARRRPAGARRPPGRLLPPPTRPSPPSSP